MIDPVKWLEEYRAADKSDFVSFEYEIEDDELERTLEAAKLLGMDLNEFINYSLLLLVEDSDENTKLQ